MGQAFLNPDRNALVEAMYRHADRGAKVESICRWIQIGCIVVFVVCQVAVLLYRVGVLR